MNILNIPSKIHQIIGNTKDFLFSYKTEFIEQKQFREFTELQMEAANIHREVFSKYKNCHRGKNVAVIGSGPSLDKWKGLDDCIQMGVNGTFLSKNVTLDYWFVQDYDVNLFTQFSEKGNKSTKKFFGMHYMLPYVKPIPYSVIEQFGAEQYFFYDSPSHMFPFSYTLDISSRPFITYSSTIFVALQFALYTHPKKIFIVGCDCSHGHFTAHKKDLHDKNDLCLNHVIDGWKKFSVFAKALYPDIEIISVNPVGLRGLFKDEDECMLGC